MLPIGVVLVSLSCHCSNNASQLAASSRLVITVVPENDPAGISSAGGAEIMLTFATFGFAIVSHCANVKCRIDNRLKVLKKGGRIA